MSQIPKLSTPLHQYKINIYLIFIQINKFQISSQFHEKIKNPLKIAFKTP